MFDRRLIFSMRLSASIYFIYLPATMLFFCVCVLSSQGNVHMAISIDFAKKQRANFKCPFAIIVAARTSPPAIITATTITYILATDGRWSPLNAYMLWKCRHRFPYKNAWDAPNASTFPSSHLDADCRDNGHATNREREREKKKKLNNFIKMSVGGDCEQTAFNRVYFSLNKLI